MIAVIMAFLKDWRACLVPAATIPVSLIGTFVFLYALGYSLNTLTLFGLILAVGIVVDDAIVVTENVQRHLQAGMKTRQAVLKAMEEVTGPVIATTLVLLAVFIPAGFLGGTSGHFYQQFAVATSAAIFISSICALTLSPVMCALLLKPVSSHGQDSKIFAFVTSHYMRGVNWLNHRRNLAMAIFVVIIALCFWWQKSLPKAFVPNEDRGFFYLLVSLPDNASLNRTRDVTVQISDALKTVPRCRPLYCGQWAGCCDSHPDQPLSHGCCPS